MAAEPSVSYKKKKYLRLNSLTIKMDFQWLKVDGIRGKKYLKRKSLPKQLGKAEKGREIHIRKNQISTQTAGKSRKG